MKTNEEDAQFITKLKKLIPSQDQRLLLIGTLLGTSGLLTEYIMSKNNIKDIPMEVKYACALISANIVACISDGKKCDFTNLEESRYEMSEQTQERIYRKLKHVIEELYNWIQENEKI